MHGVFPKFKSAQPNITTWTPTSGKGSQICSAFWYRREKITDFNAYQSWHNFIWIKKPGEDLNINRRGEGRNFLVPFTSMNFLEPNARKNIVVSHKLIIEESLIEQREALFQEIQIGSIMEGRVKNITDFGVFVDLGGIDGLLHITDISWGRVNHPSEIIQINEEITVSCM